MQFNKLFAAAILVAVYLVGCSKAPEPTGTAVTPATLPSGAVDWILTNGQILTVDEEFSIVSAMAIDEGRVVAVGTDAEILAYAGGETKRTDLAGQTVIPGLIDNHLHFVRATRDWYRHVRWDGVKSRAQALQMLRDRAATLPEGEWVVVVGGFIFDQFEDNSALFTREELDGVLADRPIYIQEAYTRAFVNSAALEAAGIDQASVASSAGLLVGPAMNAVANAMPEVEQSVWDASLLDTVQSLLGMGLTAVYDVGGNGVTPQYYDSVRRTADADQLNMRVFYSLNEQNSASGTAEQIMMEMQNHTPDLEGMRFAQFGYGETVYRPMRAIPWQISQDDLDKFKAVVITAIENGWQINEHSSREVKIDAMLSVLEEVYQTHPQMADMRFTIAHTNGMSDESIDRAKALGMVFATHSSSRFLSAERIQAAGDAGVTQPPIRSINERGGIWGLGSDGTTVASPNPFHTIGWAVSGRSSAGVNTFMETVSREDALTAHTRTNAYILFREEHLGSLEPGKLADFVVLDRDYLTVPEEEIENLYSVMTVVEGEVVFSAAVAAEPIAYTGASIWTGAQDGYITNGALIVDEGRVIDAFSLDQRSLPDGIQRVDVPGQFLVPGLVNGHGHVTGAAGFDTNEQLSGRAAVEAQLKLYARYGVTSVVSLSGEPVEAFAVREHTRQPAPGMARLFLAGRALAPTVVAEVDAEVASAVGEAPDHIKIRVDSQQGRAEAMPRDVYTRLIESAGERGYSVAAHMVNLEDARGLLQAGVGLLAHSVRDALVDQNLIDLMLAGNVCISPTFMREVSVFIYASRPDFYDDPYFLREANPEHIARFLTPEAQARFRNPNADYFREALPIALENMMLLHRAGVRVAMGTDTGLPGRFQGYFEQLEMEMMQDAGMSASAVLTSSTRDAADCLGVGDQLGTLEAGKMADFLLLRQDPLVDISNLRSMSAVYIGGELISQYP